MTKNHFEDLRIKELKILLNLSSNPKQYILRKKDFYKKLKFGDIIFSVNFSTRKGLAANAIMKFTKSTISHVKFYLGRGKIINTTSYGQFGAYEPLKDKKEQVLVVLRANLTHLQRKKLHRIVKNILESKPQYSLKGLIGHGVYKTTGFFPNWLRSKKSFFCSEFIYECYLKAGYKLGKHSHSEFVSPIDLFESKKLNIVCILDGINGVNLTRKTRDPNKTIQKESKKLLLRRLK